jgi:hypothetical protein
LASGTIDRVALVTEILFSVLVEHLESCLKAVSCAETHLAPSRLLFRSLPLPLSPGLPLPLSFFVSPFYPSSSIPTFYPPIPPFWALSLYEKNSEQIASIWLEGYILGTLLNYMVEKDPVAEAHKAQVSTLGWHSSVSLSLYAGMSTKA